MVYILKNLNFDGKDKLIRDLEELTMKRRQQAEAMQQAQSAAGAQSGGKPQGGGNSPLVEIPIGNEDGMADSGQDSGFDGGALVEIPLGQS